MSFDPIFMVSMGQLRRVISALNCTWTRVSANSVIRTELAEGTPNIQWAINPALNTAERSMVYLQIRARFDI
jgi:hypothetical protein